MQILYRPEHQLGSTFYVPRVKNMERYVAEREISLKWSLAENSVKSRVFSHSIINIVRRRY